MEADDGENPLHFTLDACHIEHSFYEYLSDNVALWHIGEQEPEEGLPPHRTLFVAATSHSGAIRLTASLAVSITKDEPEPRTGSSGPSRAEQPTDDHTAHVQTALHTQAMYNGLSGPGEGMSNNGTGGESSAAGPPAAAPSLTDVPGVPAGDRRGSSTSQFSLADLLQDRQPGPSIDTTSSRGKHRASTDPEDLDKGPDESPTKRRRTEDAGAASSSTEDIGSQTAQPSHSQSGSSSNAEPLTQSLGQAAAAVHAQTYQSIDSAMADSTTASGPSDTYRPPPPSYTTGSATAVDTTASGLGQLRVPLADISAQVQGSSTTPAESSSDGSRRSHGLQVPARTTAEGLENTLYSPLPLPLPFTGTREGGPAALEAPLGGGRRASLDIPSWPLTVPANFEHIAVLMPLPSQPFVFTGEVSQREEAQRRTLPPLSSLEMSPERGRRLRGPTLAPMNPPPNSFEISPERLRRRRRAFTMPFVNSPPQPPPVPCSTPSYPVEQPAGQGSAQQPAAGQRPLLPAPAPFRRHSIAPASLPGPSAPEDSATQPATAQSPLLRAPASYRRPSIAPASQPNLSAPEDSAYQPTTNDRPLLPAPVSWPRPFATAASPPDTSGTANSAHQPATTRTPLLAAPVPYRRPSTVAANQADLFGLEDSAHRLATSRPPLLPVPDPWRRPATTAASQPDPSDIEDSAHQPAAGRPPLLPTPVVHRRPPPTPASQPDPPAFGSTRRPVPNILPRPPGWSPPRWSPPRWSPPSLSQQPPSTSAQPPPTPVLQHRTLPRPTGLHSTAPPPIIPPPADLPSTSSTTFPSSGLLQPIPRGCQPLPPLTPLAANNGPVYVYLPPPRMPTYPAHHQHQHQHQQQQQQQQHPSSPTRHHFSPTPQQRGPPPPQTPPPYRRQGPLPPPPPRSPPPSPPPSPTYYPPALSPSPPGEDVEEGGRGAGVGGEGEEGEEGEGGEEEEEEEVGFEGLGLEELDLEDWWEAPEEEQDWWGGNAAESQDDDDDEPEPEPDRPRHWWEVEDVIEATAAAAAAGCNPFVGVVKAYHDWLLTKPIGIGPDATTEPLEPEETAGCWRRHRESRPGNEIFELSPPPPPLLRLARVMRREREMGLGGEEEEEEWEEEEDDVPVKVEEDEVKVKVEEEDEVKVKVERD